MTFRASRNTYCILVFLAAVLFTSCRTIKQAYHDVMDTYETYPPAPRTLDASTEDTGLLLVYAKLIESDILWDKDLDLEAVSIIKMNDPSNPIIVSDFSLNMVVFQGLEPGVYFINSLFWVRDIKTDSGPDEKETKHFEKKIDDIRRISVKIEAGIPHYVGKLIYTDSDDDQRSEQWSAEIDQAPEHEIEAWNDLKNRYKNSNWIPLIDKKIQQAQGKGE